MPYAISNSSFVNILFLSLTFFFSLNGTDYENRRTEEPFILHLKEYYPIFQKGSQLQYQWQIWQLPINYDLSAETFKT